ncbi:cupin domain-containing protein [Halobaculum sp. EA56]|uniref:cupin domain-containing protein n=1 Tax=Halobaculum sp. EA56 TaxID=3421648 RepID=UPI003EB744D6
MDRSDVDDAAALVRLGDALVTEHVAINRYRLPPGDGFPGGLHAHADQEEVFVVIEGEATFETLDGEVTVAAGGAVRFAPGEYQTGENRGDEELVALALGAPRESDDVRVPATCPDCGAVGLRLDADGSGTVFRCPDCGVEHVPEPCPDCGADALAFVTDDEHRPVVACDDCGATFAEAPLRE